MNTWNPEWSRDTAQVRLSTHAPVTWARTVNIADGVDRLAGAAGLDERSHDLVSSAAWLIGIGHSQCAQTLESGTGWARWDAVALAEEWGLEEVANLLAWNAYMPEEAGLRGYAATLLGRPRPSDELRWILTQATVNARAGGTFATLEQSLVSVRARHGVDSYPAKAFEAAWPRLESCQTRAAALLDVRTRQQ